MRNRGASRNGQGGQGRHEGQNGQGDQGDQGDARPSPTPRPLTGVSKTLTPPPAAPGPAPALTTAGAPVLQRTTGTADRVVELTTGAQPVIIGITHHGPGHFVVDALDGRLRAGSQLVYTDGPFAARALANADGRPVRALRIQAEAPWTIELTDLTDAVTLDTYAERPASDVLRYTGGPAIATLHYRGTPTASDGGYFLTDTFAPDGSGFLDVLANHTGPWQAEAPLAGPCLVYARADGPWSIEVRALGG
ncbi:hypothetical protein [Streptomyces showdoensis]|uniref:hypothetical protein n=1 Tax=Streptomyces showdoensis TaxID=68268 RepID=UPI001F0A35EB|nr:hypothetical protein [Streptomyces showdoensis]